MDHVLQGAFRELPWPIAIVTPTGDVVLTNEAMVRLLGRARGPESMDQQAGLARPLALSDLLPQEILDASRLLERVRTSVTTGQGFGPSNIRFRAPGVHCVYRYRVCPLGHDQEPPLAMVVFEDITQDSVRVHTSHDGRGLKAIDERLAHIERLAVVGRMMAGLAHEIKNPLAVVSGNAQFLSSTFGALPLERISPTDWKEIAAALASIGHESDRCLTVISHILGLSSRSSPDSERRERIDLNRLLLDLLAVYEPQMACSGIEVQRCLAPGLPAIVAGACEVQQVFVNLISNAQQAMPAGGVLEIATRVEDQHVVAMVRDSGVGIKREHIRKIFESFFTTKTDGQGTGLGLFVSSSIVASYGGELGVESAEGEGAAFFVRLPAAAGDAGEGARGAEPGRTSLLGGGATCRVSS